MARRTAWWSVVVLLVAGLVLVAAPSASATGWRTLALRVPATVVAGVPFDVTVAVLNAAGRPATAYRGTVRFATDDVLVRTLPEAYTFTRADRGTHTFTGVTLVGTGPHRLVARDSSSRRLHDVDRVLVADAGAAIEGQVLSGLDPVAGGTVTVYDAVTGLALRSGPADIDGYRYRITGLPAGDITVGAVVPGPYQPDFANDRDTLAQADVFTLSPGTTLVQSWEPESFGPYLDVQHLG
ncbi:hypothetical protein [Cellulomonas sp. P5_C5]